MKLSVPSSAAALPDVFDESFSSCASLHTHGQNVQARDGALSRFENFHPFSVSEGTDAPF